MAHVQREVAWYGADGQLKFTGGGAAPARRTLLWERFFGDLAPGVWTAEVTVERACRSSKVHRLLDPSEIFFFNLLK